MNRAFVFAIATSVLSCSGSTPEPAAPVGSSLAPYTAPAAPEPAKAEADKAFGSIPSACAEEKERLCLPPQKFVKRICSASYPEVTLAMFGKGTPWTRGYLRMNVEAWNASGGASSTDKLAFDEEVLVLHRRASDAGGIQVTGSGGGYDVLRWDGTCASLSDEELTLKTPPGKPKTAKIPWKSLDEGLRTALEADAAVGRAVADRRKDCKGATLGEVSPKCAKADDTVTGVVVDYIRGGGSIPAPSNIP